MPLLAETEIIPTADYTDLPGSDVVVVAVNATVARGENPLSVVSANAIIVAVIRELDWVCPDAVAIFLSNPVDVLRYIATETSTRPPDRILGCGTVLGRAHLRHQLGKILDVDKAWVHAYVIGEHGRGKSNGCSSAGRGSRSGLPIADHAVVTTDPGSQSEARA